MPRHLVPLPTVLFATVIACAMVLLPASAAAQLRPLDPAMFRAFDDSSNILLTIGAGFLHDQRASLAGTRGRIDELGSYSITWRTGRVAMTASGTALWRMTGEERVESALDGVGEDHSDAGPVMFETAVRFTPEDAPVLWLLRFGTRLPVTSLVSGLDRDEADVFATFALRSQGALWVAGEAGTSINGRPRPSLGQTDFVAWSLGAGYRGSRAPFKVDVWMVGQNDLHERRFRGTEDLSELRVGARTRGRWWVGAQWVRGLSEFSPGNGLRIAAGVDGQLDRLPLLGWK